MRFIDNAAGAYFLAHPVVFIQDKTILRTFFIPNFVIVSLEAYPPPLPQTNALNTGTPVNCENSISNLRYFENGAK